MINFYFKYYFYLNYTLLRVILCKNKFTCNYTLFVKHFFVSFLKKPKTLKIYIGSIHLYPEKDVYCAVYVYSIHIHVHVHQIHESDVYLCCVFTRNTRIFRVSKNVFLVFKVIIAYFEQIILGNYKIK